MAEQITDAQFESKVYHAELPVLVDFWAPWCGPCRGLAPVIEEISQEFSGRLLVYKMNVDENPISPAKFNVQAIPTLVFFKNGEICGKHTGSLSSNDLKELINTKVLTA
ncbi:MAG: thioredoxin [Desulfovibrionaceae bacterium]|nr:thioredoxin [Desulfovibrionaceae bacterium]